MAEIFIGHTDMAKAKKEKAKTVWTIGVEAECSCYDNGDGEESGEAYSYRGTTQTSWDIHGLRLVDGKKIDYHRVRETVEVAFKPEKGETYYLLYAIYSTGDSFGHDYGRCFEAIGVYKDRKVAELNEKRLLKGEPSKKASWCSESVLLKVEGLTKPHPYHRPWTGYFESLDSLDVRSFVLD